MYNMFANQQLFRNYTITLLLCNLIMFPFFVFQSLMFVFCFYVVDQRKISCRQLLGIYIRTDKKIAQW